MYNKESILSQIEIVKYNLRRLETLVEADLVMADPNVCTYCCMKAITQLGNISKELNPINVDYILPDEIIFEILKQNKK